MRIKKWLAGALLTSLVVLLPMLFMGAAPVQDWKDPGRLYVLGGQGIIGTDPILPYVGFEVRPRHLTGTFQIGELVDPFITASSVAGFAGTRIYPQTDTGLGHIPYADVLEIKSIGFGVHSGSHIIRGIKIDDMVGCDSACLAIETGAGLVRFGDTVEVHRLLAFAGGMRVHGRFSNKSESINDADYALIIGLDSTIHDTLPFLSAHIGHKFVFYQNTTAAAGRFVLVARDTGKKIEGKYDSISFKSNVGDASFEITDLAAFWKVENFHERGIWQSSLSGDTGTITDTAWYERSGLTVTITSKGLQGVSNSTFMTIGGLSDRFTQPAIDTSRSDAWHGLCYDAGNVVDCTCEMKLNGSGVSCVKTGLTALGWTNTGLKGIIGGLRWVVTLAGYI